MERYGLVIHRVDKILQLVAESDTEVDLVIETESEDYARRLRLIVGTLHRQGSLKGKFTSTKYFDDNDYTAGLELLRQAVKTIYEEMKQERGEYRVPVSKENAKQALQYVHAHGGSIKIIPYKFICALLESLIDSFEAKIDPLPTHPSVRN